MFNLPGPKELVGYLNRIKLWVLLSTALFVFFFIFGYFITTMSPETGMQVVNATNQQFKSIQQQDDFHGFIAIFLNNTKATAMSVILGLALGILPIATCVVNGYILGIYGAFVVARAGALYFIVGIGPHGILEIPAILIAAGIGMHLGWMFILQLFSKTTWKDKTDKLVDEFVIALSIFIIYIIPTLFVAAFIESYITRFLLTLL